MEKQAVAIILMCSPWGEVQSIPGAMSGACEICGAAIGMDPRVIDSLKRSAKEVLTICRSCIQEKAQRAGIEMRWTPVFTRIEEEALKRAVNSHNN